MGLAGKNFMKKRGADSRLYTLFSYSTKHLVYKDKIRFYYALKGRDGKSGFIDRTNSISVGKAVFLTPIDHEDEANDFLKYWKCKFNKRRIMLLDNDEQE